MSIKFRECRRFLFGAVIEGVVFVVIWSLAAIPLTKVAGQQQGPPPFQFLTGIIQHYDFSSTLTTCQTARVNSTSCFINLTQGGGAGTYNLAYVTGGDILLIGRTFNCYVQTAGTGGTNWKLDATSDGVTTNMIAATSTFTLGSQFNWATSSVAGLNGTVRMISGSVLKYTTTGTFSTGKINCSFDAYSLNGGRLQ